MKLKMHSKKKIPYLISLQKSKPILKKNGSYPQIEK